MKECPFCREEVRDEAIKCRYCGSSLVPARPTPDNSNPKPELESGQVLMIVDRGLLYFAKFVIGIVVIIVALGTAYFGFDLNKAREDVDQMKKDVQEAQKEVQEAQKSIEQTKDSVLTISKGAQDQLDQARQKSAVTQAKLDEMLQGAKKESSEIHKSYVVAFHLTEASQENTAIPPREQRSWYTVPELVRLYNFPTRQNGSDQTIGLLEFGGGYRKNDLDTYFQKLGLPVPEITAVSVDGHSNQPDLDFGSSSQVELDIEIVGAVAGSAKIRVYFSEFNEKGFVDAVNAAVRDGVTVINCSWGFNEPNFKTMAKDGGDVRKIDIAFRNAAERQVTVIVAAGDDGARAQTSDGKPHVDYPASSPWVLAVGGTKLLASGNSISSETVWNDGVGSATGGGFSEVFGRPDWQRNAIPKSLTDVFGRGVPDVTASADPAKGYYMYILGHFQVVGGTSGSAPLWAGLIALINQGLGRRLGYFNPTLYRDVGPAGVLRPIMVGNNGGGGLVGYSAGTGWSPVSGWGSPDGRKLLDWLRSHS